MKYKYTEGNGLECCHYHDHVVTHDKNKDGKECGCNFCKKLEDDTYWKMDLNKFLEKISGH